MLKNVSQLWSVNQLAGGSTATGDMRKTQRVGQREEQPEMIKRGEKNGSRKASQAAPTQCGPIFLSPTVCVSTLLAPMADSSGAKGTRQAQAVVAAALVAEDDVLLLEDAADANVEVPVPPAVLVDAVSATVEGSGVLVFTVLAVLDADGDKLLDSARAEVLVGTGVDVAMNSVVLEDVDTSTLMLTAVADDGVLLLNTYVDRVGVAAPVILEVVNDVNTSVVAALVGGIDVLLLEDAAKANVEVLLPPAVLVNAVSVTVEGSGVLVFTVLAVLDVDGDELLDSTRAEVLVGTGVDVAMNPVVLEDVNASTLMLTAVADDDTLLLNTYVDGEGVAVLVILEVVNDVNTSVVAALVAEDDVLLLEAAADSDVEVLLPPAMLVNAVSADANVEVLVPPAVLVDAVSATVEGSGVLVFTALAVLDVDGDELLDSARAEVLVGTGVDVAMNQVVIDDVDASTLVLTAIADDNVLLDAEVEVLASPTVLEDVAFALEKNSTEPSSPVKLGAGLTSLVAIGVSIDCGGVIGLVESANLVQVSIEVKLDSAWSSTGHGNGEEFTASPLRVIIYPPPHQKRPPILITVDTNATALDIINKAAILFYMSPTCVDAHYVYFDTRNKHTPASTLQEIRMQDYGVIQLLMPLLGGVVTIRERTSPLSTSPTCEERQALLILCPANCGCKNSVPCLAGKSRVVKDYGLRSGNAELISNTCITEGEIVAVFGETTTIWSQDEVREFERVVVKQNAVESDVQKFEIYVSGSNPENQCHLHVVPCEDAELALSMEITSSL